MQARTNHVYKQHSNFMMNRRPHTSSNGRNKGTKRSEKRARKTTNKERQGKCRVTIPDHTSALHFPNPHLLRSFPRLRPPFFLLLLNDSGQLKQQIQLSSHTHHSPRPCLANTEPTAHYLQLFSALFSLPPPVDQITSSDLQLKKVVRLNLGNDLAV